MSESIVHKYFNRKYSEWSITGFLNECDKKPFRLKIDDYLKSLQVIINNEKGKRREKAQKLFDKYKTASIFFLFKNVKIKWRGENLLASSPFKPISRATKLM